jgi:hypothetical protein
MNKTKIAASLLLMLAAWAAADRQLVLLALALWAGSIYFLFASDRESERSKSMRRSRRIKK